MNSLEVETKKRSGRGKKKKTNILGVRRIYAYMARACACTYERAYERCSYLIRDARKIGFIKIIKIENNRR